MKSDKKLTIDIDEITDVFDNFKYYTDVMRQNADIESIPNYLRKYIVDYFKDANFDKATLKKLSVFFVDRFYRVLGNDLDVFDDYVRTYTFEVVSDIWNTLQDNGIRVFYLVDNNYEVPDGDVRFKKIVELFEASGFVVVTPYDSKDKILGLDDMQKAIDHSLTKSGLIMYIEKDSREAYMSDVTMVAKSSEYLSIGRSKSPDISEVVVLGGA